MFGKAKPEDANKRGRISGAKGLGFRVLRIRVWVLGVFAAFSEWNIPADMFNGSLNLSVVRI